MNAENKYCKLCEHCLCDILNDPEIIISQNVFHNNICSFHRKYCKMDINIKEKKCITKKEEIFLLILLSII